jgi:hypothetical protein
MSDPRSKTSRVLRSKSALRGTFFSPDSIRSRSGRDIWGCDLAGSGQIALSVPELCFVQIGVSAM